MQNSGLDPTLLMVLSILALVIILVVLVVCAVVAFRYHFVVVVDVAVVVVVNHDAVYKTSRGRHLERKMRERACSRSSLVNF